MRFDVVSQDLKHVTSVQDFETLICMNSLLIDKQVTSVKVALSPKVSFGIRLLSNMNRILMRVF